MRAGDPIKTAIVTRNDATIMVTADQEPDFFDTEAKPLINAENIMSHLKQLKSWKKQVQYVEAQVHDPDVLKAITVNSKKGGVVQRAALEKMNEMAGDR